MSSLCEGASFQVHLEEGKKVFDNILAGKDDVTSSPEENLTGKEKAMTVAREHEGNSGAMHDNALETADDSFHRTAISDHTDSQEEKPTKQKDSEKDDGATCSDCYCQDNGQREESMSKESSNVTTEDTEEARIGHHNLYLSEDDENFMEQSDENDAYEDCFYIDDGHSLELASSLAGMDGSKVTTKDETEESTHYYTYIDKDLTLDDQTTESNDLLYCNSNFLKKVGPGREVVNPGGRLPGDSKSTTPYYSVIQRDEASKGKRKVNELVYNYACMYPQKSENAERLYVNVKKLNKSKSQGKTHVRQDSTGKEGEDLDAYINMASVTVKTGKR